MIKLSDTSPIFRYAARHSRRELRTEDSAMVTRHTFVAYGQRATQPQLIHASTHAFERSILFLGEELKNRTDQFRPTVKIINETI